jgi:LysM repeat protein
MSSRNANSRRHARLATGLALTIAAGSTLSLAGCIVTVERIGSAGPVSGSGGPAVTAVPSAVPAPTGPTPIPSFVRPTPTPAPTFMTYVVKSGDSLNTIAHRYGTTARSIAFWNRGTYPSLDPEAAGYRPDVIRLGWPLVLIPNVKFDEQTLPGPTPNPTDPSEADPLPS